jgi:hypothetical protein
MFILQLKNEILEQQMFTYHQEYVLNKLALTKFCRLLETSESIKCNPQSLSYYRLLILCKSCEITYH